MAPFVVEEGELGAVGGPAQAVDRPRIGEEGVAYGDRRTPLQIEEPWPGMRDAIARLQLVEVLQFWLHLIFGRGLDEVNFVLLRRFNLAGDDL